MTANVSALFNVKSDDPIVFVHQYRTLNHRNSMIGVKLAGISFSQLTPYTLSIIELISGRCSESCQEVTPQQFRWVAHLIECFDSKRVASEVESAVSEVLPRITVSESSSLVRDAATALCISRMVAESVGQVKKYSEEQILNNLCQCYSLFGLSCWVDGNFICSGRKFDKQNCAAELAQITLGLKPGENNRAVAALAGANYADTTEGVSVILNAGVTPDVGRFLLTQYALSGMWPVDAHWIVSNPYYYDANPDWGTSGLGASSNPPEKPQAKNDLGDVGITALGDLLKVGLGVGGKYLESQIKQSEEEAAANLKIKVAKALDKDFDEVSDQEVYSFAKENPVVAKAATEKALQNNGISGADIKEMLAAQLAMISKSSNNNKKDEKDNTLLYVGIGAGVLALGGITLALMRGRHA